MPKLIPMWFAVLALAVACTPIEPDRERPAPADPRDEDRTDPVRIKGLAPHLVIHRQRDGTIEELSEGAVAHAGDLVQISYVAAGNQHGVVLSIDGRGEVTLHHPSGPQASTRLVRTGLHALDHAYELDDAQSYERFVFITSGHDPIDVPAALDAAQRVTTRGPDARHSPLPLPRRWQQRSVTLEKRP
ncbi:MAG: ActD-like protein [Myxococcota bacterium]